MNFVQTRCFILMKIKLFIMLALLAGFHQASAQGTAFTYQGRLNSSGVPADGTYDFQFILFNTDTFQSNNNQK